MKLDATYVICRDEEDVLESILGAVRNGKALITGITFANTTHTPIKKIVFD